MKAELSEDGMMYVTPETPTEAYALRKWAIESFVLVWDEARREKGHWRGSKLVVGVVVRSEE